MRVFKRLTLIDFYEKHPDAKTVLEQWYNEATKSEWTNLSDIKKSFNSVDYVGNQHYVFNIIGNKYRLVVVIKMTIKMIYIRLVGTHTEYDKINASQL